MRGTLASMGGGGLAVIAGSVLAIAVSCHDAPASPQDPGGRRVRMSLDVAGELLASAGPDAGTVREPVEMAARFEFTEAVAGRSGVEAAPAPLVCRWYLDATATMRVGGVPTTVTLAPDARRILVARRGTTPTPYLADGFLSGDEADLLDTPFDAILIDDLLTSRAVATDASWEVPADVTAGLLAIDTVDSGGIEARLEEVTDGQAKIAIAGIVDGAADGVPTHVTVEGHCFVEVADGAVEAAGDEDAAETSSNGDASTGPKAYELRGPVLRLAAVIRERRQASHVAPGFEVEARLSMSREPVAAADAFATDGSGEPSVDALAASRTPRRRGAGAPGHVWYRDAEGRIDLVHDARWRRVEEGANGMVMRLIDRGALIGQCSITSLPGVADAPLPSREDVRRDVERSLAGQVAQSEAAEEWTRDDGLRVVRIASSGTAGRLPFRWIHYVLAAQDGGRASVTFMFEDSMQQRFGDVDRPLIEGLRLGTTTPESARPGATAAVPDEGRVQTR